MDRRFDAAILSHLDRSRESARDRQAACDAVADERSFVHHQCRRGAHRLCFGLHIENGAVCGPKPAGVNRCDGAVGHQQRTADERGRGGRNRWHVHQHGWLALAEAWTTALWFIASVLVLLAFAGLGVTTLTSAVLGAWIGWVMIASAVLSLGFLVLLRDLPPVVAYLPVLPLAVASGMAAVQT